MALKGLLTFGPEHRLPNKAAFDPVFQASDIRCRRHPFSLLALKHNNPHARLGIVVAKRNVPRAVDRNRLRRALRESFRRRSLRNIDIVVLVGPGAANLDSKTLHKKANRLFQDLADRMIEADQNK